MTWLVKMWIGGVSLLKWEYGFSEGKCRRIPTVISRRFQMYSWMAAIKIVDGSINLVIPWLAVDEFSFTCVCHHWLFCHKKDRGKRVKLWQTLYETGGEDHIPAKESPSLELGVRLSGDRMSGRMKDPFRSICILQLASQTTDSYKNRCTERVACLVLSLQISDSSLTFSRVPASKFTIDILSINSFSCFSSHSGGMSSKSVAFSIWFIILI